MSVVFLLFPSPRLYRYLVFPVLTEKEVWSSTRRLLVFHTSNSGPK